MERTLESSDISKFIMEGCHSLDDWLIFDSDSGILFIRKSRHKVIHGEDGESSILSIITQSGESLGPGLFACDENWMAS